MRKANSTKSPRTQRNTMEAKFGCSFDILHTKLKHWLKEFIAYPVFFVRNIEKPMFFGFVSYVLSFSAKDEHLFSHVCPYVYMYIYIYRAEPFQGLC